MREIRTSLEGMSVPDSSDKLLNRGWVELLGTTQEPFRQTFARHVCDAVRDDCFLGERCPDDDHRLNPGSDPRQRLSGPPCSLRSCLASAAPARSRSTRRPGCLAVSPWPPHQQRSHLRTSSLSPAGTRQPALQLGLGLTQRVPSAQRGYRSFASCKNSSATDSPSAGHNATETARADSSSVSVEVMAARTSSPSPNRSTASLETIFHCVRRKEAKMFTCELPDTWARTAS